MNNAIEVEFAFIKPKFSQILKMQNWKKNWQILLCLKSCNKSSTMQAKNAKGTNINIQKYKCSVTHRNIR